jgi:hypothetical protein
MLDIDFICRTHDFGEFEDGMGRPYPAVKALLRTRCGLS